MSNYAIHAEKLSKRYILPVRRETALADPDGSRFSGWRGGLRKRIIAAGWGGQTEEFWALREVSFKLAPGDMVGVIGRNGAGKSTLLKLLSRISAPTSGSVDIRGRVASLLEVGSAFHPELSGRENIFLNGAVLGMKHAEVKRNFDAIVAFADVEDFLDTPVKNYSSGMYLRLAFAVAAHLETDILLVDEVLAVADAAFQNKCLGKMGEVSSQGRTVLLVSHGMAAIRQLCNSVIWMDGGQVAQQGATEAVIRAYLSQGAEEASFDLAGARDRSGSGLARLASLTLEDNSGTRIINLSSGHPGRLILGVASRQALPNVRVSVGLIGPVGRRVMTLDSRFTASGIASLPPNGQLVCDIPRLQLAPGSYQLELSLESNGEVVDALDHAGSIEVEDGNFYGSGRAVDGYQLALTDFRWTVEPGVAFAHNAPEPLESRN